MKHGIIAVGMLLLSGVAIQAQGLVGTGESWSYQFASLPYIGDDSMPAPNEYGGVMLTLSSVAPATHYTLAIFENNLNESPIAIVDSESYPVAGIGGLGIWQDLQGCVQLSVVSGSLSVDLVQIDARLSLDASHSHHYQSIVAVPESTSAQFFALAAGLLGLWRGCRRYR